jgi:hypothetical protein
MAFILGIGGIVISSYGFLVHWFFNGNRDVIGPMIFIFKFALLAIDCS